MKIDMDQFKNQLQEWGVRLTDAQAEQFQKYADLLLERNKVMNLTAITDEEGIRVKHFLDSLAIYEALSRPSDGLFELLYPADYEEEETGVLSFTPALCAAMQVALCLRFLCGRPLSPGRLYSFDLLGMDLRTLRL